MSNYETLLKTGDLEVTRSKRGAISFSYDNATFAMFDMYERIKELENKLNELTETATFVTKTNGFKCSVRSLEAVLKKQSETK